MLRTRSALTPLLLLALAACTGAPLPSRPAPAVPAAEPAAIVLGGIAFSSLQWQVRLVALPAGVTAPALQRELQAGIDAVGDALTTYRPDSELMRLNARPVGDWGPASPLLLQALAVAADTSRVSGGAYDVTVGPLVELWGFGAAPAPAVAPTPAAVAAAKARVGWDRVGIDAVQMRVARLGEVRIDLSSLGEGAGVEALAAVLERAGVHDYLVRVAGTARQHGQRPGGGPWRLAIEHPRDSDSAWRTLAAGDSVVSTSGNYRNVRDFGGQRVAHTLDPVTGYPVRHEGVSVTVVLPGAEGAMRADALATALNVLGPENGLALATREGLAVLFVERQGSDLGERWSPAFAPYLTE